MTNKQVSILQEEIAIITIMVEHELPYKDAKLVYTYPDIQLGKKCEHYQTKPY
jgi:hypothetical protein